MNPDSPKTPHDELEARLTALLLGELSTEEAAAWRAAIATNPELAKLHDRLKHVIDLVREVAASPSEPAASTTTPLKLSEERRQKLLTHFKTVRPKELVAPRRYAMPWLPRVAAAAAVMVLLIAIALPNFVRSRSTSRSNTILNNLRQLDGAKQQWALENKKSAADIPTVDDLKPYLGRNGRMPPSIAGETYNLGSVGDTVTAEVDATKARELVSRVESGRPPNAMPGQQVRLSSDGKVTIAEEVRTDSRVAALSERAIEDTTWNTVSGASIRPPIHANQGQIVLPPADQSSNWRQTEKSAARSFYDGSRVAGRAGGMGGKGETIGDPESLGVLEKPAAERFANVVAPTSTAESLPQPITGQSDTSLFRRRYGISPSGGEGESRLARSGSSADTGVMKEKLNEVAAYALASPPPLDPTTGLPANAPAEGRTTTPPAIDPTTGSPITAVSVENGRTDGKGQATAMEVTLAGITSIITSNRTLLSWSEPSGQLRSKSSDVEFSTDSRKVPVLGDLSLAERFVRSESAPSDTTDRGQGFLTSTIQPQQPGLLAFDKLGVVSNDFYSFGVQPSLGKSGFSSVAARGDHENDGSISVLDGALAWNQAQSGRVGLPPVAYYEPKNDRITEGERIAPESKVHSVHLDGFGNVSAKPVNATPLAYQDKKRELDELVQSKKILTMQIARESIDTTLPKTSPVTIVDQAQAQVAQNPTAWQRISRALGADAESVARIRVEDNTSDLSALSDRSPNVRSYDPYSVQTELETIKSEAVLGDVVQSLNLNEAWASKSGARSKLKTSETISLLKKRLDVHSSKDTGLVEIRAKSDKPEEAAKIANAVAEAYQNYRLEQRRELTGAGITALAKQFDEQEQKVREAQKEVDRLRAELSISETYAGGKAQSIEADVAPIRKPSTNAPIPQPEIQTSENNFSTFSLNVSDVSFKLAAASLEKGQMPDAASVRSEEFINAFDYRDPEPAAGAPIAFAWERARYPFAHNRDLLRFSLKTAAAGRQAGRPLNIVLLLDNSGSMERADRIQIIREALRVLASQLQPQDKLSVITFARTARLVADGISGDKAGELAEQVSGLTPQGGTNLEEAMNLAYATAAKHYLANGMNRVVLLTDGAANLGDVEPDSLKQKVEAQRKQGIALDCFGIGWDGFNDDLLEVLSRNGDGRYGFINSPEEAATDFVGQLAGALKVAASDVKVQVEFNPRRVATYRQIGYAKHQLTKEQFRDNTVDAAEIASQEAGNALYTVEVNPAGDGPLCTVRVRYKIPGTSDFREQEWDVPYTGNVLSLEQSSPAMRLAAGAGAFAEWLVASPFAGEVTPDRVLGVLSGVPEVFGADSRPNKLEWMIRQAKSLEGK